MVAWDWASFLVVTFLPVAFFAVCFVPPRFAATGTSFAADPEAFFATRLIFAQRAFIAAAILARPAADILRRGWAIALGGCAAGVVLATPLPLGRPGFLFTSPESDSDKSTLAC